MKPEKRYEWLKDGITENLKALPVRFFVNIGPNSESAYLAGKRDMLSFLLRTCEEMEREVVDEAE